MAVEKLKINYKAEN